MFSAFIKQFCYERYDYKFIYVQCVILYRYHIPYIMCVQLCEYNIILSYPSKLFTKRIAEC